MNASSLPEKASLRRSLLQTRRTMAVEDWQTRSQQICTHLQTVPLVQQAKTVLAYFSIRQEPDLTPLFTLDKTWGFPRCQGSALTWHHWSPGTPLESGAFNIPEPHADAPPIAPDAVDLLLVPCVACDDRGYRLGYGGGFYDRLLDAAGWKDKVTIGILFDFARLRELAIDPWDHPLHGCCTEAGFHWFLK